MVALELGRTQSHLFKPRPLLSLEYELFCSSRGKIQNNSPTAQLQCMSMWKHKFLPNVPKSASLCFRFLKSVTSTFNAPRCL
ncbi:hypothetical protein CapIbe_017772 [Capra ibex]